MKISDLKAEALLYPLEKPFWNGRGAIPTRLGGRLHRARACVLVRLYTDEGIVGLGEAGLAGAPPAVLVAALLHHVKPLVVGEDAFAVERLWRKVYEAGGAAGRRGVLMQALSGLDIALWDAMGKALGVPVSRLFGVCHERVPAYASAGFYAEDKGAEALAEEMAAHVATGFGAVKMKIGALTLPADVERVEAVREAIGDDCLLMVDANSSYSPKEAIRMAEALEDVDLAWFEEPVRADDVEGSAQVVAAIEVPVAGYETEFGLAGFRDLIVRRAVEVVQPDVAWVGGFSESRRIAALATAYDLPCNPHAFSSALTTVASLHLLASLARGGMLEFDRTPNALRDALLSAPLAVDAEGYVAVPDGPGLGVTLNEDTVARYRVEV